jgi:CRP-like cAMP-binding protein
LQNHFLNGAKIVFLESKIRGYQIKEMKNLLENIESKITLSATLKNTIDDYFKLEIVPKNKILLKENGYCKKLYFLEEGLARTYYFLKDKEITSWFYREADFFTSWASFYTQEPSNEYIETSSECQIYSIEYFKYQELLEKHPQFERFGRLLAEEQTAFIEQFSRGFMFATANEKYGLLLDYFPDIELYFKLGHIASFLDITQETLSRIRKRKD